MTHFDTWQVVNDITGVPMGTEAGLKFSQAAGWNWPTCETRVEKRSVEFRQLLKDQKWGAGWFVSKIENSTSEARKDLWRALIQSSLWPESDSQNPTWSVEKRVAKRQERGLGNPLMSLQFRHEWLDFHSVRLFDDSGYKGLVLINP